MRALVWLRADLRAHDNTALAHASRDATGGVVCCFLLTPSAWRDHDDSPNKIDLIRRTLAELSAELAKKSIPLLIRAAPAFADAPEAIERLMREHACGALYFNRQYEINEARRDEAVSRRLESQGIRVHAFHDQVAVEPGAVLTGGDTFFRVFSPFARRWRTVVEERGGIPDAMTVKAQPEILTPPDAVPEAIEGFEPTIDPALWPAGEREAQRRLRAFVSNRIASYHTDRDRADLEGTSALSPYLTIGAISPRECLRAAIGANDGRLESKRSNANKGVTTWINELIWREFYKHILVGFPSVCMHRAFVPETDRINWRDSDADFCAWRDGLTGYPIVDAAIRCLTQTGWMHNRLRMIVAMFLSKDLHLDWRLGERHFMRTLVDGDLAANNGGWQWSASTGADAQPYFRVMNPYAQSEKADPDGAFIRRWVPELRNIEGDAIHQPERLGDLRRAALDYPLPIVDHKQARLGAIEMFKAIKR
ncbi:MAG: deoxyribodipyrimidine photo-lyase [Phycisphaeraceae bacterium]|nr:deoxyribodipyrimidine photo-lyase [Phycisphaeraceae bacterium]MCB9848727.1 deoxyribodipyrimidine photo-lyase [Phycisphaeraceae bacterium]